MTKPKRLPITLIAVAGADLPFGFLPSVRRERPLHRINLLESAFRRSLGERFTLTLVQQVTL
jgi:hypothetical protein